MPNSKISVKRGIYMNRKTYRSRGRPANESTSRLYSFELVSLAWIVDRNKVCRKSGESAVEAIFVNLTTGLESKRQRLVIS